MSIDNVTVHFEGADARQASDPEHDFRIQFEGSIVILWPDSSPALHWCWDKLPETAHRWGKNGYVIENHYIDDVVLGMRRDGLKSDVEVTMANV